ncbi:GNAT family N-acetyltransferase [Flavobacterium sp. JP2137]|uniref:GNAT family N-acetyltransferase n=1 Tax=Flavobacterium sp. JP2137 TaxID=3414510 RepID=UPI003D2FB066
MSLDVELKQFTPDDFEYYFKLVNDIRVMAMISERAIPLEEAARDFTLLLQNNEGHKEFGNFKIIDKASQDFLGLAKLELALPKADEAELGYMILPEFWGRGIATSAVKLLLARAEQLPTLTRLFAIIDPKNIPSRKLLINSDFVSVAFKDFDGLPGEIVELRRIL